jgi:hypothetical protein
MTFSEKSMLPGWPYLLAACLAYFAYKATGDLPDEDDEDYLSERYNREDTQSANFGILNFVKKISAADRTKETQSELSEIHGSEENDDEYAGLLSEIDEMEEELVESYSRETRTNESLR